MKKALLFPLIAVVICGSQTPIVHAETAVTIPTNHLLITEVQTSGAQDATEEFIEVYNPGDIAVNATGWQIQYRAASATAAQTWPGSSIKATLACPTGSAASCTIEIAPHGRLVLVHTIANIAGALPMSGGFSDKGGQIRLVQPGPTPIVHDFVGYGTAADAEGTPASAPSAGRSIKRIVDADDIPIDTNQNAADFIADCGAPTPGQNDTLVTPAATGCSVAAGTGDPTTPPASDPSTDSPTEPSTEEPGRGAATYLPVLITEVFPDPASPQKDSADEFIELYNPNDTPITLSGYRLQTGSDYHYSFTLGDTPLGPHRYLAIPSAVSKLSLANTGSGVRLMDPAGTAYEAPAYGAAKEGESWMQDDTGWHWTLTPTPGLANILTLPAPKVTAAAAAPKKVAAAKTTAAPKIAVPKAPKATTAKASPVKTTATTPASAAQNPQYWLLLPIGLIAGGYVLYEYRHTFAKAARRAWAKLNSRQNLMADE